MYRLLWILTLVTVPEAVKVPLFHSRNHVQDEEQLRTQNIAQDKSNSGGSSHDGGKYKEHQFDHVAEDSKNTERKQNKDAEKKKVVPLEHLAAMAYDEPGSKWKVLGYSEITGYPIIDLSDLGISNEKKTSKVDPAPPPGKAEHKGPENKPKPASNSAMNEAHLLKKTAQNLEKSRRHEAFMKNIHFFEKDYDAKGLTEVDTFARNLHSKLHRTHLSKEETVRSILYPTENTNKYRVGTRRRRLQQLLNLRMKPDPKGKYDIRHFDLEKLMDIIVTDAALLTSKYIRDIPSLPLIYECKVDIMFRLFKILSGFQSIVRFHGRRITKSGETVQPSLSQLLENWGKKLLNWILGIRPSKPSVEGLARNLEHDLTMFQGDLPHLTDRECEGEMDERDWDNFNFHYNFLLDMGKAPDTRRFWGRRTNKGKANN